MDDSKNAKTEPLETKSPFKIEISDAEKRFMKTVPPELVPFELAWLRVYKSQGWEPTKEKNQSRFKQMREAFRQGWNAQVYMKTDSFVLNKAETESVTKEEAKENDNASTASL